MAVVDACIVWLVLGNLPVILMVLFIHQATMLPHIAQQN